MALYKKDEWVAALRSGDYLQGKGFLRTVQMDSDGREIVRHCCLGVYAEICGVTYEPSVFDTSVFDFAFPTSDGVAEGNEIPDERWAEEKGISDNTMRELAENNDSDGWSFEIIADWIERNL